MNKILVVNVNWLGDAVFSSAVFKELKHTYPRARISCLCVPRVRDVLQYCPYVDEMIVYDERGEHRFPWTKLALIAQLRGQRFDAAFLLHRSMTRSLLVFLAGIPLRIGYGKAKGLLTHPVDRDDQEIHRADFYLKVLEGFGIRVHDRTCELRLEARDAASLDLILAKNGIGGKDEFVVVNTGGNWELKRWSAVAFASLARRLWQDLHLRSVFSGAQKDKEACQRIASQAGVDSVVLAGETSLGESLALYKRAAAVISADSGPLHLASSVGADVIAIFGPTRPEITGPRGHGRSQVLFKEIGCNKAPCYHLTCGNNVCMQSVTVDDVCEALKKLRT